MENTTSGSKKPLSVKKLLAALMLIVLSYFWVIQPLWFEAWCCAAGREKTWLEVYRSSYADGGRALPAAIACDGMRAGMDLYVCYPLSVGQLVSRAEEAYGVELRVVKVTALSRWHTECVAQSDDGSLHLTLSSHIKRWYSDNGSWLGYMRITSDDLRNEIREQYAPMLGY